jgi:hypothetical protein
MQDFPGLLLAAAAAGCWLHMPPQLPLFRLVSTVRHSRIVQFLQEPPLKKTQGILRSVDRRVATFVVAGGPVSAMASHWLVLFFHCRFVIEKESWRSNGDRPALSCPDLS